MGGMDPLANGPTIQRRENFPGGAAYAREPG
jgi:hypothetical protein